MMTDVAVFVAFLPLSLLAFKIFERLRLFLGAVSVLLALGVHVNQVLSQIQQPLLWLPVALLLILLLTQSLATKTFRPLVFLGVIFASQATITSGLFEVLLLLVFSNLFFYADVFLAAEELEKRKLVISFLTFLLSLTPAALCLLLKYEGDFLLGGLFMALLLRLFSLSLVPKSLRGKNPIDIFALCSGVVSCYAIWRIQPIDNHALWTVTWVMGAVILSVGTGFSEVAAAMSMALLSLSPLWGAFGIMIWPLVMLGSRTTYLLAVIVASMGAIISGVMPQILIENVSYALWTLAGIALGRNLLVALHHTEKINKWIDAALIAISLCFGIDVYLFFPDVRPGFGTSGFLFLGTLVVSMGLGKILSKKRPMILSRPSQNYFIEKLLEKLGSSAREVPKKNVAFDFHPRMKAAVFFQFIEGEANMALMLGLLGAILIWGFK